MELITILEAIAADEPADETQLTDDSVPITGFELDESDWDALGIIKDGRGDNLPDDTISWLRQCGLVEAETITLSQFAIEWMRWAE